MKHGKNRYYRRSRIPEKRFRRLIRVFAMDLTATDAAELTGLSVRSVNSIYLKLRQRLAEHCETQSPVRGVIEVDESYFGPRRIRGKRGRGDQWTTGTPAMQVGDAIFNIDAAYTVALDRDEQTRTLTLTRGTVMLAFNGHTLETLSGLTIAGGTLKGSGTILGNVIQTGGTLAAGHSPGAMTIDGDYLLDAGTLQIELAGSGGVAGIDFDFYDITGTATLSGVLELIGWDGFTPTAGQTFSVLTASSIDTTGLTLAGLDGFTYSILAGGSGQVLQLQAVPEPATGLLALGGAFVLLRRRR